MSSSSALPAEIAETIQAAHINRSPSPTHDLNPSTAASAREPVILQESRQPATEDDDLDTEPDTDADAAAIDDEYQEDEDIPYSVLKPRRRSAQLPPMPDLRFEQSYLNSISKAQSWGGVAWITARDQVMMPLVQGVVYNLFLLGWQHWNRSAKVHGNTVGARVRRWWYGVNNWPVPRAGG